MKKAFLSATLTLAVLITLAQTPVKKTAAQSAGVNPSAGYNIPFTLTPYKKTWVYLGTTLGKNYILVDSSLVDGQSKGVFKGKTKLTQGIYFFVSPNRSKLFDFLVDGPQHFTVTGDSASAEPGSITGSPDNTLFLDYTHFLSEIGPKMNEIDVQLKSPNLNKDKEADLKKQWGVYNRQMIQYRENITKTHPNSVLTVVFNLLKTPEIPTKLPALPNGKPDSSYIGRYIKEHYWDDVAFDDDRILHTPPQVFDGKLENYIKYYVSPDPDSIFAEINYMLLYSRTTKELHHYLLGRFTDKYINPEIMGQDKVFVDLYTNYFAKGDTLWLNSTQRKYLSDRYYTLISGLVGNPAPELKMLDTANKAVNMHDIKAPFTFIIFWDPTCSHCKEEVPRLDSMYEAKWKAEGVKIFAVNINAPATMGEWKSFIKDHHLEGWVHAYQTKEDMEADAKANRPNFRQTYDVFQTPTMYLLDNTKHIIAKRLSIEQFDGVIDAKLRNPNTAK